MEIIKLKQGEKEYEVIFTARAIAMIEKELRKPISELGTKTKTVQDGKEVDSIFYSIEELAIAIKQGCKVNEEISYSIIDDNPGCAIPVLTALQNKWVAIYVVAEQGNSESPEN